MFHQKPAAVWIVIILIVLLPMASTIPFKSLTVSNGLNAFQDVINRLISHPQQHSGISAATSCPDNITEVIRECYRVYVQAFGLDLGESGKLPSFTLLQQAVDNPLNRVAFVCSPYNVLHGCIAASVAPSSMPTCMSSWVQAYRGFRALTVVPGDSVRYSTAFAALEYVCGEGYNVFHAREACLRQAKSNVTVNQHTLVCNHNERLGPVDSCSSLVITARCADAVFSAACGADAGNAMCRFHANLARYLHIRPTCLERVKAECVPHPVN